MEGFGKENFLVSKIQFLGNMKAVSEKFFSIIESFLGQFMRRLFEHIRAGNNGKSL